MERSTIKYLAEFLAKLDDGYGESIDVNRFCMDADEKKLDITDDLSWCKDFERTVGFIQRIFSKPHLHVKYVKEVIKVQTANRIDAEGFALTMREPKLWEDSEDGPRPKSVYMTLFEDEYAIYENRFIKMLVDEMIRYLMEGFEQDPQKLWSSNLFGKPLSDLVREGLSNKLMHMPADTQLKVQQTLEKIINEGCGGMVCILL